MPPRLRMSETDDFETCRLMDGSAEDYVLLRKLKLPDGEVWGFVGVKHTDPEITIPFEEIFKDEPKRIGD